MAELVIRTSMPDCRRNEKRDDQSGQYASNYDDEVFLDALATLGETGAREVSEEVGCDYDTARRRLRRLAEQGEVDRRQVSSLTLWTVADGGRSERDSGEEASA